MFDRVILLSFIILGLVSARKMLDLSENPKGLSEKNITIDFESCDHTDYNDEEYIDLDNTDSCHKIHMFNKTIQEVYGSSVRSCCGFHGYLAIGQCQGIDPEVISIHIYFVQTETRVVYHVVFRVKNMMFRTCEFATTIY